MYWWYWGRSAARSSWLQLAPALQRSPDNNANKTEAYDCSSFSFSPDCIKHDQRRFCRRCFLPAGVLIGRIQRQAKTVSSDLQHEKAAEAASCNTLTQCCRHSDGTSTVRAGGSLGPEGPDEEQKQGSCLILGPGAWKEVQDRAQPRTECGSNIPGVLSWMRAGLNCCPHPRPRPG